MAEEPLFLKEVNDFRTINSASKIEFGASANMLMCCQCLLTVLNNKNTITIENKEIKKPQPTMKLNFEELTKQEDKPNSKKLFPNNNSHLISDEFTVLKVPGLMSPQFYNSTNKLANTQQMFSP
jgi:hypothetical protein